MYVSNSGEYHLHTARLINNINIDLILLLDILNNILNGAMDNILSYTSYHVIQPKNHWDHSCRFTI